MKRERDTKPLSAREKQRRAKQRRKSLAERLQLRPEPAAELGPREVRLLSKPEVCDRVGRTFPTVWRWMRAGKFPRSRSLHGRPVWVESEIDAFIAALPVKKLKGDRDE